MDDNILRLTYNGGAGRMTLDLDHFLPCAKDVLKKIEKLILEDNNPIERVQDICRYISARDVRIDDYIETLMESPGMADSDLRKEIQRVRHDQDRLRATREELQKWAEKKRLIW